MTNQDRKRFAVAIAGMAATFRQEVTTALTHGYWVGLHDLTIEQVETGIANSLRHSRLMPPVAEIRELAGVLSAADAALIAWNTCQRAVGEHGAYASVDFEDRAINATVRNLGGWERLCGMSPEEFDKWVRKDFLAVYPAMAKVADGPAGLALGGIHERTNNGLGFEARRKPVLVRSEVPQRMRIQHETQKAIASEVSE